MGFTHPEAGPHANVSGIGAGGDDDFGVAKL